MCNNNENSVPFDPGFSRYLSPIDTNLIQHINNILALKTINQRKFQLQILEQSLVKPFNTINAIYCGCVKYGSIIATKYTNSPAKINDNPMYLMPVEEKQELDLSSEVHYILEVYHKLNKTIEFCFKRKSKLPANFGDIAQVYLEFVELNNDFKDITSTSQIKIPQCYQHFKDYSLDKLSKMEESIIEITTTGKLEEVFNIS